MKKLLAAEENRSSPPEARSIKWVPSSCSLLRAAWDGTLEFDGDAYTLRLRNGSVRYLVEPPALLAGWVGNRVWIAVMAADEAPIDFGLICSSGNAPRR